MRKNTAVVGFFFFPFFVSKKWIGALATAGILAISSTLSVAQGPGWTAWSTVVSLVNTANGGVNVRLSPDLSDCVSQSGYGPTYASVYPSHPGINRMKADLLAAFLSGARVRLYLSDSNCTTVEMILER